MMVAQKTKPRLQAQCQDEIGTKVMEKFGLTNRMQLPKLSKIVINVAVGRHLENQKLKPDIRDTVISTLTTITGQKPVMVLARKSVSNFKVREGAPSAFMVTMRRDHMWNFLDRFINLAAPRIKDFRGLKDSAFDNGGSYTLGLTEQAVWPEIDMAKVTFIHGMNINIVFERSNPEISKFLLGELGFPFTRKEN